MRRRNWVRIRGTNQPDHRDRNRHNQQHRFQWNRQNSGQKAGQKRRVQCNKEKRRFKPNLGGYEAAKGSQEKADQSRFRIERQAEKPHQVIGKLKRIREAARRQICVQHERSGRNQSWRHQYRLSPGIRTAKDAMRYVPIYRNYSWIYYWVGFSAMSEGVIL